MEISFSSSFQKSFRKRIKGSTSEEVFWKTIEIFIVDLFHPQLKNTQVIRQIKRIMEFFQLNLI